LFSTFLLLLFLLFVPLFADIDKRYCFLAAPLDILVVGVDEAVKSVENAEQGRDCVVR